MRSRARRKFNDLSGRNMLLSWARRRQSYAERRRTAHRLARGLVVGHLQFQCGGFVGRHLAGDVAKRAPLEFRLLMFTISVHVESSNSRFNFSTASRIRDSTVLSEQPISAAIAA